MKSLISLWSCTAYDYAVRCYTSAARDVTYVTRRTEHEGLWFLAVTLADFGKSFQRWLDHGFVVPSDVPSFARGSGRLNGLPKFLSGFLGRVFDPASGVLLDEPDIEAIFCIRQLTLMFSKISLPEGKGGQSFADPSRKQAAIDEYIQCEYDVRVSDELLDPQFLEDFSTMSEVLFGELFSKLERDLQFGRLWPKHGPGAVAERLSSNAKFDSLTWPTRLEEALLLWDELCLPNQKWKGERRPNMVEPGSETPVRVITVPKTIKTPRVIAIEPTAMQYAQQAIFRSFRSALKEDGFLYQLIGIDDQEPNRELARSGSHSGDLATLDLSEASDRVSNQHVVALFANYPHLQRAVQACRSTKADVPGHGVIPLSKFASMGSALCFPVEAMVFATIIFLGIGRDLNTSLSREACKRFHGRVRVFGDDLIVPRDNVLSVVDELSTFGCKVNVSKSYWTGRFRESCGKEYYDGHDVSIVKVRRILPTQRQDANGVVSTVALRNLFYWSGSWRTAAHLDTLLRKVLPYFPNVGPDSPLLGRESALGYQFERLHPNYHSPITKGYRVVTKAPQDHLEGPGALLKCLLRNEPHHWGIPRQIEVSSDIDPRVDLEHLERSGRPKHVNIKLGWSPPY
jgi:hypothetical protein